MGISITGMWGALLHHPESPHDPALSSCGVFPQAAAISSYDLLLQH